MREIFTHFSEFAVYANEKTLTGTAAPGAVAVTKVLEAPNLIIEIF
jgi:hypothetical protein